MRIQSGKKTAPINLITFKYTERENESERKIFQAERKNRKIHNVSKYFEVLSPVDSDVAPFHIVLTCEYERKKATHGTLTQSINTVIRLFIYSLFFTRIPNKEPNSIQFNGNTFSSRKLNGKNTAHVGFGLIIIIWKFRLQISWANGCFLFTYTHHYCRVNIIHLNSFSLFILVFNSTIDKNERKQKIHAKTPIKSRIKFIYR